jgi:hypothetical protein
MEKCLNDPSPPVQKVREWAFDKDMTLIEVDEDLVLHDLSYVPLLVELASNKDCPKNDYCFSILSHFVQENLVSRNTAVLNEIRKIITEYKGPLSTRSQEWKIMFLRVIDLMDLPQEITELEASQIAYFLLVGDHSKRDFKVLGVPEKGIIEYSASTVSYMQYLYIELETSYWTSSLYSRLSEIPRLSEENGPGDISNPITEELFTFQKFSDKASALQLGDLFYRNKIEFTIEDTSSSFEPTFNTNELDKEYRLKIRRTDFDKASKLLLQISQTDLDSIDKSHYLYEFTDEELLEIIQKPDEWSSLDFLLAQKILKEKGKEVKIETIEALKKERLKELAAPESSQRGWIIAGYISAALGGLLGLFIGWHLLSHKKTLPNGERVYSYPISDRKNGNNIFLLGILSVIFWISVRLFFS